MDLEREVLQHLSREITTNAQLMMTFRSRIAYTVWIGPFVVVGAYLLATKERPTSPHWDGLGIASILLAVVFFAALAWVLADVEKHTWDQCNKWREKIALLHAGLKEPLRPADLHFEPGLRLGYGLAGLFILLIFFTVLFAAIRFLG
jgi:hypothetical protein